VVGLANSGPNTNGSQIFISYAALPHLDGFYTIFGQVTFGMEVLRTLTELDPQFGDLTPSVDKIVKVSISEQ
jgi:cyclophilin family peptidyl-prolyl cis-trans isomerase